MKNQELFNLVQSGKHPLVRVINERHVEESIWDNGMIGRIELAFLQEEGTRDEHILFHIKEKPFRGINQPYMLKNYYDKHGNPTLNYVEANFEPKNGVELTYCMGNDVTFELVNAEELVYEYLKEETETSYVEWLENKVISLMK